MNMKLRVEGYWVDLGAAGFKHFGKEFHDNLPDIICHGDDEEDDDWVDLPINDLDELGAYLHAFKDFSMVLFLSEGNEEVEINYSLANKKIRYHDGKYINSRIEVNRDVVAKRLNDRVVRAIDILQADRFDFGEK